MNRVDVLRDRFGILETWNVVLVNTTPHAINVMLQGAILEIPAARQPLRLREEVTFTGIAGAIPLFRKQFFLEDELPPEDEEGGVLFIVPALVAQFFRRNRRDLIVPHDFIRDVNGTIIGCRGFSFLE